MFCFIHSNIIRLARNKNSEEVKNFVFISTKRLKEFLNSNLLLSAILNET